MRRDDRAVKVILLTIALFLGMIALRPLIEPGAKVFAEGARFDHVYIVSPLFLYKGQQGLLVMDRRNANVWFIPKVDDQFKTPVFMLRVPLEMLDQAPR